LAHQQQQLLNKQNGYPYRINLNHPIFQYEYLNAWWTQTTGNIILQPGNGTGLVGIGTNSPTRNLEIASTTTAAYTKYNVTVLRTGQSEQIIVDLLFITTLMAISHGY